MDELSKSFPKIHIESFQKTSFLSPGINILIPKGPKAFAWFTYLEKRPICIFLLIEGNEIQKVTHHYVSFKDHLALGTIFYGTLLKQQFILENLYYDKGNPVYLSYPEKLNRMKELLGDIQKCEFQESVQFYLPKMCQNRLLLEASNMPYAVYGFLSLQHTRMFVLSNVCCTFLAKRREEMEDVYDLYALDEQKNIQLYSTALLNDFKTSHMMKRLSFKNKPHYKNVELSDSEDEEEPLGDFCVQCLYISDFKRWKPYSSKSMPLSFVQEIKLKERNYYK
jgi:hypothetical protein